METEQYKKMTETPVSKLIIMLGIPTTISMLVTNIYNMADAFFVGKINNSASGAIGIVFGLMAIIQAFGFMFGHGAGSIISRKLGAGKLDEAKIYASSSFAMALLFGTVFGSLGIIFINPLMKLLGSTSTILPYAKDYALYILIAAPIMAGSFVLNNILRYEGLASLAMIGLTTGGALNIFGDWLLISRFNMGVKGAGIATAISQCISFLILLSIFLCGKTQCKLSYKYISFRFNENFEIIKTGFPSLVRQGLTSISTMILNSLAGIYGSDAAVAAMTIVNKICFFIFAVGLGIGQGFQPVSAFNYGAGKYKRVKKGFYFTFIAGEVCLSCLAIIGFILSPYLIKIFRNNTDVIRIGTFALRMQLAALFFQPLALCTNMMFQSIGKNKQASFLSMLRSGIIFIPLIFALSYTFGLKGVEVSQAIADMLTFFVTLPFLIKFMKVLPDTE